MVKPLEPGPAVVFFCQKLPAIALFGFSPRNLGDNLSMNELWLAARVGSQCLFSLFSQTACQHAGVKEMRTSTIIKSSANVYRFGGRGGDQLVTRASRKSMWHVSRSLGKVNGVEDWDLPKSIAANSLPEIECLVHQPAQFHNVLSPRCTSLAF
jgi:hypothetical protein